MAAATKRIAPVTASAAPMELASFPRGGKLALGDISRRSLLSKSLFVENCKIDVSHFGFIYKMIQL